MNVLLILLALQQARDVEASDRPVEIRVPVDADARHPAAVVSFPEETLEALVAGWAEGDLSVERRRDNLFLKLLRKAEGDLHVLGGSGVLYRLAIRPAEGAYDGHVRILAPQRKSRGAPEAVELIRSMRLGRRPDEGRVLRSDAALWSTADLAATALLVYDTERYRGFVIRVENRSGIPQHLDPARFVARDLILSGCRENLMAPGGRTLLYLVFGKMP